MPRFPPDLVYGDKYQDNNFEYRNVILTKELFGKIKKDKILKENEWRALGIAGSKGWEHYEVYKPEPHILLLRKPLPK
jgi:cyclin-dependent kinase regulatory subunit CKS1